MSLRSLSLLALAAAPMLAHGQSASPSIEERLRRLEERQEQLEQQVKQKDARIEELEQQLGAAAPSPASATPAPEDIVGPAAAPAPPADVTPPAALGASGRDAARPAGTFINPDTPLAAGRGFEVGRNEYGSLSIRSCSSASSVVVAGVQVGWRLSCVAV